jgi:aconitate hydratase
MSTNTFGSRSVLRVGSREYTIYRIDALDKQGTRTTHLPYSLRILLENLLRTEDGRTVKAEDIRNLAAWDGKKVPTEEIAFSPSRVLMQDFTGVPAVVDLAAMRDAMKTVGGDANLINPLVPAELVIDHSVQVDFSGRLDAPQLNADLEFKRNGERYAFLRWGQQAFKNTAIVPPDTGIVHQINLEYLARVVFVNQQNGTGVAYPDTVVGTDSHTTMINGLGVLGWGVGGIEAEAAMLGQPVSMLIPQVVGVKLTGTLPEGATATDLVLTIVEMLRKEGVVGKFVEYYGPGIAQLSLADRAVIANMGPEYGATCGIFPIDAETLNYLRLTGRTDEQIALVEAYCKEQGLFHTKDTPEASYSTNLQLDLGTVKPSLAGPKRPQDRVTLDNVKASFEKNLPSLIKPKAPNAEKIAAPTSGPGSKLKHGSVVLAAITSCTNTSNPSLMLAAGLVAKKAVERGVTVPDWVKTSLAPGSKVATEYFKKSGLLPYLEKLRFHVVGYGCTTCIGNSGPLPQEISDGINASDLVVASVLSGNRNFEGRIHPEIRANYLASPPLVVAYAIAGRIDFDPYKDPLAMDASGKPVYLKEIWPTQKEVAEAIASVDAQMFKQCYSDVFKGDPAWQHLKVPSGNTFAWDTKSTYIKNPPYFDNMPKQPAQVQDIKAARVLLSLADSITTDHISPAGNIKKDGPAGKFLIARGVAPADFNSYGSRRGNDDVMVRGTFANVRIRNKMVPGVEGGVTRHLPDGEQMSVYDASVKYKADKVSLIVLAGKDYGCGSSRDWAAKGTCLLGVRAVIAESFERIHRSNLVGMGILPLMYPEGQTTESLGLTGEEVFEIGGLREAIEQYRPNQTLPVKAKKADGSTVEFKAKLRIDTPQEAQYYKHGGILQYVLRQLLGKPEAAKA